MSKLSYHHYAYVKRYEDTKVGYEESIAHETYDNGIALMELETFCKGRYR